ncbi:MAG TPA: M1 family metallopeptidase [Chitinophagaceae bacterium]|nr:M1 family metallopeptidase [Chitinophagaceae bacterium]
MKYLYFSFVLLLSGYANGQNYDPYALFSPQVYPVGANEYRNAAGEPGPSYWQNKADYNISAALDDNKNEVTATVTITYHNNSPQALTYIWLTLEQTLFNPSSRGYAKMPATGISRYGDSKLEFSGGFRFKSVKLISESGGKWNETNADTVVTDTRMQVRLPKPLASKADIKIKLEYSFTVPEYGADRMGVLQTSKGKIFALAQWYPRVCVFDDLRGWNTDPYLGAGEFYLEYGDYEVSITAPADHIVVSSGELTNPSEVLTTEQLKRYNSAKESAKTVMIRTKDEVGNPAAMMKKPTLTWKYKINNARDLAWASSKAFVWDAASIDLPGGKKALAQSVYPVESEGNAAWGRSTEFIKGAIEGYSKRWFPYPYPAAVNVACNVSGMEYPGIIFCSWKDKGESLWGVTDHEFGHTWFPMIVGSNERRYGWMDEGFNTFINMISSNEFNKGEFGQANINGHAAAMSLTDDNAEKVMLTPDGMQEENIGLNLYFKRGYALMLLREHILGEKRFDFAFRKYTSDWAFKHPSPWDFFRSMENSSGEDLYWFWKGLFLENYKLDQSVESVTNTEDGSALLITLQNKEKMAMPVVLEITTMSGKIIRKNLPVEIWQSSSRYTLRLPVSEKVRKIVIDPDNVYPDMNPRNNVWQGSK